MPYRKALRNGEELVIATANDRWHLDLILRYQKKHNLTEDEIDVLLETEQLLIGDIFIEEDKKPLVGDFDRDYQYRSIDAARNSVPSY